MGPTIQVDQIGGVHEIAKALGCAKQQISALRKRHDFPAPVATLAATPLWDLQDIESFRSSWQRRARKAAKPIPEAVPDTPAVPTLMEQVETWNNDAWR